jgi:aflatoxin B1 aldehyde reductase
MSVYLDYRHDQNKLACSHTQLCKEFEMPKAPITNIIFGTMTLGYRGYGARVHDAATADAMLGAVLEFGHDQLDTCSVYGDGTCEQMLGDLRAAERFGIATRFVPNNGGHEPENLKRRFKESLARLKTDKVKILYLSH